MWRIKTVDIGIDGEDWTLSVTRIRGETVVNHDPKGEWAGYVAFFESEIDRNGPSTRKQRCQI